MLINTINIFFFQIHYVKNRPSINMSLISVNSITSLLYKCFYLFNCPGWNRTIAYHVIYALPTELQGNFDNRSQLMLLPMCAPSELSFFRHMDCSSENYATDTIDHHMSMEPLGFEPRTYCL